MNVSPVGSIQNRVMSPVELNAQYDVAVLKKHQEVVRDLGVQAVRLIQSAGVGAMPHVGKTLDVSV